MEVVKHNNLETFRVLHIIKGVLSFLTSLFFLIYVGFGSLMTGIISSQETDVPFNPGIAIIVIGGIGFMFYIALGICNLVAANNLKKTKNYNFVFGMAIVNCISGVLGILLGVFTLIELTKPHVKQLFGREY